MKVRIQSLTHGWLTDFRRVFMCARFSPGPSATFTRSSKLSVSCHLRFLSVFWYSPAMRIHFDHIPFSFFPGIISSSIVEAVVPHYGPMARSLSVTFYIPSELTVSSYFQLANQNGWVSSGLQDHVVMYWYLHRFLPDSQVSHSRQVYSCSWGSSHQTLQKTRWLDK